MPAIITLTTDFEERDPYAASIKGVLCTQCPGVQIVDLSHDIPRRNVFEGAFFLAGAVPYFPAGTVHLAAVASGSAPIAVSINDQFVVGPDNGLVTLLAERFPIDETRAITSPEIVANATGQVYYGREVFAPAAAKLATGGPLADLGEKMSRITRLEFPQPERGGDRRIEGRVIHVNRFGTLVSNIHRSFLDGAVVKNVEVGQFRVGPVSKAYDDAPLGCPVALFGEAGYLEIAYNGDRADQRLGMGVGIAVDVTVEP